MAKTKLNVTVDSFFKKYASKSIDRNIVKENFSLDACNDYGNLLHAIVNYDYDETLVLELVEILLEMGIDPNYKGKSTGFTFLHLALYGKTTETGQDISFSEDFLVKLIGLARKYNFDVNTTDKDNETVLEAAIASEVYKGSIIKIFNALGYTEVSKKVKSTYEKYLEESKADKAWHKRLLDEKYFFVDSFDNLPEQIGKSLEINLSKFESLVSQITVEVLEKDYQEILELIKVSEELIGRLIKAKAEYIPYTKRLEAGRTVIKKSLSSSVTALKAKPSEIDIKRLEKLVTAFGFFDLASSLKVISDNYFAYCKELIDRANSLKTVSECDIFLEEMKDNVIVEEAVDIARELMNKLTSLIADLREMINKQETIVAVAYADKNISIANYDYNEMTKEELELALEQEENKIAEIYEYAKEFVVTLLDGVVDVLKPLIANEIITYEYLDECVNNKLKLRDQDELSKKSEKKLKNTKGQNDGKH